MKPIASLLPMVLLCACAPGADNIAAQMQDHDADRKVQGQLIDALNQPGGPDYAAAVGVIENSGRTRLQQDYDIGNLTLKACREGNAYCAPPHNARDGVARLTRVASASGEDARIAAADLAAYLSSGAGPTLPPDPARADCWRKVADGSAQPATCTG